MTTMPVNEWSIFFQMLISAMAYLNCFGARGARGLSQSTIRESC